MPTPKPVKAKATTPKLDSLPALVTELWGRWVCHREIGVDGWNDVLAARGYRIVVRDCRKHPGKDVEWNIFSGPNESPDVVDV